MEVRINDLQKLVHKYIKKNKPLFIKGHPGIGKSQTIDSETRKIAEERGRKFIDWNRISIEEKRSFLIDEEKRKSSLIFADFRIAQIDPVDLKGLPGFNGADVVEWKPNLLFKVLSLEGIEGVLFFDEFNLAPPSVQGAAYQVVLDKCIGELALNPNVAILAAGNLANDRANIFPMSGPLKNRFSHATLMVPSQEEWTEWAIQHGVIADIIAFLAFKPSFLYKFDGTSKDDAFPTPRTNALASTMIEDIKGFSDKELEEIFMLVATCCGEGYALEYQGFLKLKKRVKVDDILKNPKKVRELDDVGLKYTLVSGLSEKYKGEPKLADKILAVVQELELEFGVFLLKLMKGARPKQFVNDMMGCNNYQAIHTEYKKFIL